MQNIRLGATGEAVKLAQARLNSRGFGPVVVDGVFGRSVEAAVVQFQQANALTPDGVVGDRTWDALLVEKRAAVPQSTLEEQKAWLRGLINASQGVTAVLEKAVGKLGAKEDPDGSNDGAAIHEIVSGYYSAADEARMGKPPWCALFVSWAVKEGLGIKDWAATPMRQRFGGAGQWMDWGKRVGRWSSLVPLPGDVFVMARDGSGSDHGNPSAGHCGLVVAVEPDAVVTLEGNSSNAVVSRRRKRIDLLGYARWA